MASSFRMTLAENQQSMDALQNKCELGGQFGGILCDVSHQYNKIGVSMSLPSGRQHTCPLECLLLRFGGKPRLVRVSVLPSVCSVHPVHFHPDSASRGRCFPPLGLPRFLPCSFTSWLTLFTPTRFSLIYKYSARVPKTVFLGNSCGPSYLVTTKLTHTDWVY